jgi:hypothetical protein
MDWLSYYDSIVAARLFVHCIERRGLKRLVVAWIGRVPCNNRTRCPSLAIELVSKAVFAYFVACCMTSLLVNFFTCLLIKPTTSDDYVSHHCALVPHPGTTYLRIFGSINQEKPWHRRP